MKIRVILLLLLLLDFLMLSYEASSLSITFREVKNLYAEDSSFINEIIKLSINIFGQNDMALRMPMIVIHLLSVIMLFLVSKKYLLRDSDRLWLIGIFILLPGINSSALLIDNTSVVILLLFVYVYVFFYHRDYHHWLLIPYLFIDISFAFLYLSLFYYSIEKKEYKLTLYTAVLFVLSLIIYTFDTHGSPKGHFLDTVGIYIVIFSPIIFFYIFYVLYRLMITKERDILWYLSFVPLMFSLILSIRQVIEIQYYAPFLMLSLPLATKYFFNSYRVRLKEFRRKYRLIFYISLSLLVLNTLVVVFNKEIYRFMENPKRHFAYRAHVTKELAMELKKSHIDCIDMKDNNMQLRLSFYGIGMCDSYEVVAKEQKSDYNVTISYNNKKVYEIFVSNVLK